MQELLNQQWRAYVRNIPAAILYDAIANIDWDDGDGWSWCVEMALDASGTPRVMTDYGVCPDDESPQADDGNVLVVCPIAEDTTKQNLMDFDAAAESDWETEWVRSGEDDDEEDDDENDDDGE